MIDAILSGVATASSIGAVATSLRLRQRRNRILTQQRLQSDSLDDLVARVQAYLGGYGSWEDLPAAISPAERSKQLLREHLSPKQRQELAQNNSFTVKGSNGVAYTIACHRDSYNVSDRYYLYCTHTASRYGVPLYDEILAQKLMIETDIDAFLRVANRRHRL